MENQKSEKWYHKLPEILKEHGLTFEHASDLTDIPVWLLKDWCDSEGTYDPSTIMEFGLAAIFQPEQLNLMKDPVLKLFGEVKLCEDCDRLVHKALFLHPDGWKESRLDKGCIWMEVRGKERVKCKECASELYSKAIDDGWPPPGLY